MRTRSYGDLAAGSGVPGAPAEPEGGMGRDWSAGESALGGTAERVASPPPGDCVPTAAAGASCCGLGCWVGACGVAPTGAVVPALGLGGTWAGLTCCGVGACPPEGAPWPPAAG